MSEPTVLGMINKNLNSIAEDQKAIATSVAAIDKAQAVDSQHFKYIEKDIKELKTGQKKIKKDLYTHIDTKELDYKQGYKETIPQRAWRRKDIITISTAIAASIGWLLTNYFGG